MGCVFLWYCLRKNVSKISQCSICEIFKRDQNDCLRDVGWSKVLNILLRHWKKCTCSFLDVISVTSKLNDGRVKSYHGPNKTLSNFTVVLIVPWPLSESEAGSDFLLLICKLC